LVEVGLSLEGGLGGDCGSDFGVRRDPSTAGTDKRSSRGVGLPFFVLQRGKKWRGKVVHMNGEKVG
jgi:hypothetical protein